MKEELPVGFKENMIKLLGEEASDFFAAMGKEPAVSVRLNRRKPGADFSEGRKVKWCDSGFYLNERPVFTLDPLFHAGAYYVQDASSMIYEKTASLLYEILKKDSPSGCDINVLDLCAAPGGKTTAMINGLPDGTRFVANEYVAKRASILKENLIKWGYRNVEVTNKDTSFFPLQDELFDIVAVDAPCSGEGMMRKDEEAVRQWSPRLIEDCAVLQKKILKNAFEVLTPGGYLIYSTCTFNRFENEENVDYAVNKLGLIPTEMDFPEEWGIMRGIDTSYPAYRFMPHKTEGEGLFLAVLRKPGVWQPSAMPRANNPTTFPLDKTFPKELKNKKGKKAFSMMKNSAVPKDEAPSIENILAYDFDRDSLPMVELDRDKALAFLRRESLVLDSSVPKGYVVASFKGHPLGLLKNIGIRANNLYPKNWRILMNN